MFFGTLFPQVIVLSAGTSFTLPITFKPLQRVSILQVALQVNCWWFSDFFCDCVRGGELHCVWLCSFKSKLSHSSAEPDSAVSAFKALSATL